MAEERAIAYALLYDENVSKVEYEVMESLQISKILALTSASIKPAGAVIASLPTIFLVWPTVGIVSTKWSTRFVSAWI
nr:hypothetical protein GCM10020185_51920 [Pseudomonas brassicacearum subsp. brassicacearum]